MRSTVPIFVEARDLRATVGLSRPRVYALMAVGEFPLPRRISKARVAWLRSDLEKWAAWRPVSAEPVRHIIPDHKLTPAELAARKRKQAARERIRAQRKSQRERNRAAKTARARMDALPVGNANGDT